MSVYTMRTQRFNKEDYLSLESTNIDKKEASILFGEELLIRNDKMYVPKDTCRHKLWKLHKRHGVAEWSSREGRRKEEY